MGAMPSPIGPVRRLALVGGGLACVGLGGLGLVVPGVWYVGRRVPTAPAA